jgi:putative Mg2+ transporter-C (MgtC) family protein
LSSPRAAGTQSADFLTTTIHQGQREGDMGTWQEVWHVLAEDFGDLPTPAAVVRLVVRLLVPVALGGLLGWQREKEGKAAGMRTHMLVAGGAALFILVAQQAGIPLEHLSRVIQGVVAGIGFLGAGAILKLSEERVIKGLTTAASIWMTAAVGLAAGLGREQSAIVAAAPAFVILSGLRWLEARAEGGQANSPRKEGGTAEAKQQE